jgi:hypothetical protein
MLVNQQIYIYVYIVPLKKTIYHRDSGFSKVKKNRCLSWRVTQVVEYLLSKPEALSSSPSTEKRERGLKKFLFSQSP